MRRLDVGGVEWFQQPLTRQQREVLHLLATTFVQEHQWPSWRWLRKQLGTDAASGEQLLRSLPATGVREGFYGREYGYLSISVSRSGIPLQDTATIGLTVAGLGRGDAPAMVTGYLNLLAAAVQTSQSFEPDLSEVTHPTFTRSDAVALGDGTAAVMALPMYDLLRLEPPFWSSPQSSPGQDGEWTFALNDHVERYRTSISIEAYLAAVTADVAEINLPLLQQTAAKQPVTRPWWRRAGSALLTWLGATAVAGVTNASATGLSVGVAAVAIFLWRRYVA